MNISLILCTRNRCTTLRRALDSLCAAATTGLSWELLLVDNNSKDHTRELCAGFVGRLPMRYLFESRQGKSPALNRAIAEAKGDLLVFTDDDVEVEQMWLRRYWEESRNYPEHSFFGGRVIPSWECDPPRWLAENCDGLLRAPVANYDLGDVSRDIHNDDELFYGANLAIRRDVFRNGLRFDESLGPQGRVLINGEESAILTQLMADGHAGLYIANARVYHWISKNRMTEAYLRRYFCGFGRREIRLNAVDAARKDRHTWDGVPRWVWRRMLHCLAKYAVSRCVADCKTWLKDEIEMSQTWGWISELRQRTHVQSGSARGS